jgi:hypothetical protein
MLCHLQGVFLFLQSIIGIIKNDKIFLIVWS